MKKNAFLSSSVLSGVLLSAVFSSLTACAGNSQEQSALPPVAVPVPTPVAAGTLPFSWDNATVYFLLTDRFNNVDPRNDLAYGRKADAAELRGYMGGDLAGITAKIREGYFDQLGVDAIWLTPPVEQIHGSTDEGSGVSYAFHGYWARDFTSVDANLGTAQDMQELVDTAHAHGIHILLDIVMNHVGPVTSQDSPWPASWVRDEPVCTYKDIPSTVTCALVKGLPDIRTESDAQVALPGFLVDKWKTEGRYEKEVAELDAFFARTGFPRAPRYYLMKWQTDWVRKYGVDGFRADTTKHVEPQVWKELKQLASQAYEDWKVANPAKKTGDQAFFMTGEVGSYGIGAGQYFTMDGGTKINFYNYGFDSLINFGFKYDATQTYENLFSSYSGKLHGELSGYSVLNYISSHDDDRPFDLHRQKPLEAGTRLLLSPGSAQIYYGDETARNIDVTTANGDARLRSFMNWDAIAANSMQGSVHVADILTHWRKLGLFRHAHPAVGAGVHQMMATQPYTFKRTLNRQGVLDQVVVALDLPADRDSVITVQGAFNDGVSVRDAYSGKTATVVKGTVRFDSRLPVALIELNK
ncbi:alpha-amylase family glycosyl hydrolase [Undibacterium oligocarboniphilum]|uniref:Alpha-amylase n=1 Tax=Undibacterium oligocarboniphilum TaxID=666702 RepID=A0A850QM05_9BURK|nr:alpha-amylase family glycosyl hydrolase [Undibacterium oligocarboniphilum]MBC3870785.1 alpha-amylase [Undibacterium oligocarboniphilum]NVO78413.1 alpha-amylase [Undibacterium oligocarboniphilum]